MNEFMVVLTKRLVQILKHHYGFQEIGEGLSRVVLVSPDAPDCVIKLNLFAKHLTQNENEIKVYEGTRKTNVPLAKIIGHSDDNKIIISERVAGLDSLLHAWDWHGYSLDKFLESVRKTVPESLLSNDFLATLYQNDSQYLEERFNNHPQMKFLEDFEDDVTMDISANNVGLDKNHKFVILDYGILCVDDYYSAFDGNKQQESYDMDVVLEFLHQQNIIKTKTPLI